MFTTHFKVLSNFCVLMELFYYSWIVIKVDGANLKDIVQQKSEEQNI